MCAPRLDGDSPPSVVPHEAPLEPEHFSSPNFQENLPRMLFFFFFMRRRKVPTRQERSHFNEFALATVHTTSLTLLLRSCLRPPSQVAPLHWPRKKEEMQHHTHKYTHTQHARTRRDKCIHTHVYCVYTHVYTHRCLAHIQA